MNASFWSFCGMGPFVIAIPYSTSSAQTGPFVWSNQGTAAGNTFTQPANAPGGRVGAVVGQFLMLGDVLQQQIEVVGTGNGVLTTFNFALTHTPMLNVGSVYDQGGKFAGSFNNGMIVPSGTLSNGTVNYESGALSLTTSVAPPNGDSIYALYTQAVPYRVQWCAIGDPTNWPIPLTANAIAFQSSYEDLEVDLGAVKFVAGYPLYGVIFQEFGITRANYVGGNVVFSFSVFERNRGLIAKGAIVVVGGLSYFISQDGFFETDGNSTVPIGTDSDNNSGIDQWFNETVNMQALEAIRAGYDSTTRCVYFAIPTGTNTLPDTLLTYNPIAVKWTKSGIATETIWTDRQQGNDVRLGLFDQNNQYSSLTGPTLNGYMESCDVTDSDGNIRFAMGVRPNIACTDTPQALVGVRNSMQDALLYTTSAPPDAFSRICPAMAEGLYTRVRISSAAASSFNGATLYQQPGGPV